jgi:hypothetical protein
MNPESAPGAQSNHETEGTTSDTAPALWNPNAAASWSLIFTPIFGSIVQGKNWRALGETKKAEASARWTKISLTIFTIIAVFGGLMPDSKTVDGLSRLAGFVLLISWYYANGKQQNAFVLARYGKDYKRKRWFKPLGLAVGCVLVLMVVAIIVGLIAGAVSGEA